MEKKKISYKQVYRSSWEQLEEFKGNIYQFEIKLYSLQIERIILQTIKQIINCIV